MSQPLFPCQINSNLELRILGESDAGAMYTLLERNRDHLDRWLRWSGRIKTLEDTQALIQRFAQKYQDGDGFHAGMWFNRELVGGIVCHFVNRESNKTEIGYWLSADAVRHGLVTQASRTVINYLFSVEKMHRIEIQCATDNLRSKAVAERLGFTLEGIKRDSDWLTSRYADHCMYSLLEHEWPQS